MRWKRHQLEAKSVAALRALFCSRAAPLATNWTEFLLLATLRLAALGFTARLAAAFLRPRAAFFLRADSPWPAAGFRAAGLLVAGLGAAWSAFGWAASKVGGLIRFAVIHQVK